jgi:hypothetical protein
MTATTTAATGRLDAFLGAELADPDSGFSIGVSGAIAEFFREQDEPQARRKSAAWVVATARGAMRIVLREDVVPVAIESLSRNRRYWQQRVALCLPERVAVMAGRGVVTELGADTDSIRDAERHHRLFDLGLGIGHVDACVRTGDPQLIELLRDFCGCSLLNDARAVSEAIIAQSPHRVFVSRLGRIEVYAPIPRQATPTGPHTHFLPRLLGRAAPWARLIPESQVACVDVYPANPLRTGSGGERPFDAERHARFQGVLKDWGPAAYVAEKQRIEAWVRAGAVPENCDLAGGRLARAGRRVALRQLIHTQPVAEKLCDWRRVVEGA